MKTVLLRNCMLKQTCIYICNDHHNHHHHTVQVAMCAYSFVRTLVNALVLQEKTPPAQVAAGDDDHDCKWSIFASWWKEKHHQRKLRSVKTILGTSIGAGCSNQMQVAQGQDLHFKVVPLCKLLLCPVLRNLNCVPLRKLQ